MYTSLKKTSVKYIFFHCCYVVSGLQAIYKYGMRFTGKKENIIKKNLIVLFHKKKNKKLFDIHFVHNVKLF